MKKSLVVIFLLFANLAYAEPCIILSAGDLAAKIGAVAAEGACGTSSPIYREKYDEYRGTNLVFHVLKFDASANFNADLPCMSGYRGEPLVIIAAPSLDVVIKGSQPLCIDGDGVIIDNIDFDIDRVHITSSHNAFIDSRIEGAVLKIDGDSNFIVSSEVSGGNGNGVEINGDDNRVIKSKIHAMSGFGVYVGGYETRILESYIYDNEKGGLFTKTCGDDACEKPRTVLVSHTEFYDNMGGAISVSKWPLSSPADLVSVDAGTLFHVTGNVLLASEEGSPWGNLNIKALRIELFLKDGPFVAETDKIEKANGQFVISLPRPLVINGREYSSPVFVATAVDTENQNTSPFSRPLDVVGQDDLDNDGIENGDEDYNHNGTVDFGETDPRNPDTDTDGLTDGEERLHIGRVGELINKGVIFADLSKLNPTNSDSDGDCLNDGLELGIASAGGAAASIAMMLRGESDDTPLSSYCRAILKKHNVDSVSRADADPATITDPTNSDSDGDTLKDGEEDWNFNGKRDISPDDSRFTIHDSQFLETDPNLPDSDGDTFLDGAEGDTNKNGKLDDNETDSLLSDTDGDGVSDDIELMRLGSLPNSCDTDKDGLSDGIEAGIISPDPKNPACSGLQTAGTNFASIGGLSAVKTDSDGDGISDGVEDANHNGWLDLGETDPTISDTDGDLISDGVESSLDTDRDGFPDVDITTLVSGDRCSPPKDATDVDCDDIPNARDIDSDNDGCLDRDENVDKNVNGLPDLWEQGVKSCGNGASGGSTSINNGGIDSGTGTAAGQMVISPQKVISEGGGACSLVMTDNTGFNPIVLIMWLVGSHLFFRLCWYDKRHHSL